MIFVLLKKISFKINTKSKKILFLLTISFLPFILVLLTTIVTGAKIRTMWMTPFYLFMGTLFFEIQRNFTDLKIGFHQDSIYLNHKKQSQNYFQKAKKNEA